MKKLIIAFDIGTTFSGVSYCVSEGRGHANKIQGVTRFPGQPSQGADSKIPSHLLYLDREAFRVGGEVDEFERDLSDEAANTRALCTKTSWFKLELRPESLSASPNNIVAPQLPRGVSAVEVYADFLRYLFECTKKFIRESEMGGIKLLQDEENIRFIITHPNGWEHAQQRRIRSAAKIAGLVSRIDDPRLRLLTEGEAAIHHCVHVGLSREALESDDGIMVIDAGGGTIDMSAYRRSSATQDHVIKLEEIVRSECLMSGSVFVTQRAQAYLQKKLAETRFENDVKDIAGEFDQTAKRLFKPESTETYIKFGRASDTESSLNIRSGHITLSFETVASFFEPSVNTIIQAVEDMKMRAMTPIKYVFLVGGFSGSPWLFEQLKNSLNNLGISVTRPDLHVNKAVADGAVAYYLNRYVTTRVARLTYGTKCYVPFDVNNPAHNERENARFVDPVDGKTYINGLFCPILLKGTQVNESQEFSSAFFRRFKDLKGPDFENPLRDVIICYRGDKPIVAKSLHFMDLEPEKYEDMFTLQSTLDHDLLTDLVKSTKTRSKKKKYVHLDYEIKFLFGLTELKVQAAMRYKKQGFTGFEFEKLFEPRLIHFDRDDSDDEDATSRARNVGRGSSLASI